MISIVILAAGASRRMSRPKQVLLLGGKPLVWRTAQQACRSAADKVLVVTGAYAEAVEQALAGLPVIQVYNPKWADGQAESVKAGLSAIPQQPGAVIFLPADQPLITPDLLNEIIESYHRAGAGIIAPIYNGCRSTPVLFDLKYRVEMLQLTGDQGARKLLDQYPQDAQYIPLQDPHLLIDADTPEEYEMLKMVWASRKEASNDKT